MLALFQRNLQPIIHKRIANLTETHDTIERKIDGVKFDMRDCVDKRSASFRRAKFSAWHMFRCY